jgi:murein DD-endopeptidase MepM/ murein hydrolase activator NlpD
VVAADDGVVTFAGPIKKGGGGIAVKIQDSRGCVTEYMHLNQVNGSISVGDHVRRGTDLGEMGRTGDATGTHLHFGLECNGKYLDPVKYMIPRSTSQLSMSCRDLINSLRGYSSDDEAGGGARPGHTRNSNVTN